MTAKLRNQAGDFFEGLLSQGDQNLIEFLNVVFDSDEDGHGRLLTVCYAVGSIDGFRGLSTEF